MIIGRFREGNHPFFPLASSPKLLPAEGVLQTILRLFFKIIPADKHTYLCFGTLYFQYLCTVLYK